MRIFVKEWSKVLQCIWKTGTSISEICVDYIFTSGMSLSIP